MTFPCPRALLCVTAASLAPTLAAQSFTLALKPASAPCDRLDGSSAWVECVLGSTAADPPVDGWSLGLLNYGAHRIAELSLAGTAGEPALTEGFVFNEILPAGPAQGAVSIVALSTAGRRTLPPGPSQPLLLVRLEASSTGASEVRLVDDLESAAGRVRNIVQSRSRAFRPTIISSSLPLDPLGPEVPHLGFAMEEVASAVPYHGILGGRTARAEWIVPFTAAGEAEAHVFPCFILEQGPDGGRGSVQGWSLSLGIDGEAQVAAVAVPGALSRQAGAEGFLVAREVDPAVNGGSRGAISAVVLSFIQSVTLPPVGTYAVLDLHLSLGLPCPFPCATTVAFRDGLSAAGAPPVECFATIDGAAVRPCNVHGAWVKLIASADEARFLRGNANGDGGLNIADAIFVLAALFGGGSESGCRDGEDANADLEIDVSDAVSILQYLFLRGAQPPAPFPECGTRRLGTPRLGCRQAHAFCA